MIYKETYLAPTAETVELKLEGVILDGSPSTSSINVVYDEEDW